MKTRLTAVAHFAQGAKPTRLYELSEADVAALLSVCADGAPATATQATTTAQILSALAAQKAWLACHCQGESLKDAPILYQQKTRAASRMLVRNYDREAHQEACPLFRLRSERAGAPAPSVRTRHVGAFGILTKVGVAASRDPDDEPGPGRRSNGRMPLLGRILFSLLESAGLNVIGGGRYRSVPEQYAALRRAMAAATFDGGGEIPVSKFSLTTFDHPEWLEQRLRTSAPWPDPLVPQGFLVGVIAQVDDGVLVTAKGTRISVSGQIAQPGEETCGPYIAIALVGRGRERGPFEALRAYVHPVFRSSLLVPVDSDLERRTLEILLAQQKWLASLKRAQSDIEKPLSDIADDADGTGTRPDFLWRVRGGRTVVVETMGYADVEYLERKARTHAVMARIGCVVEHGHGESADKAFRSAVSKAAIAAVS